MEASGHLLVPPKLYQLEYAGLEGEAGGAKDDRKVKRRAAKRPGDPEFVLSDVRVPEEGPFLMSQPQDERLSDDLYRSELKEYQPRLLHLQRALTECKRSLIVAIEGPDAAGKGGAIKRMLEKLDPRLVRVYSVVKPTTEEYDHHYMWRFWSKVPPYGQTAIFDRSWYGRVLVERVEGFATPKEWSRAYREINDFERALVDDNAILVKLFFSITKEEQLDRFEKRAADPLKYWKISEEDWRNRAKWDEHIAAAEDMFRLTSTEVAPWYIIPADSKYFERVATLRLVVERIEDAGVKLQVPKLPLPTVRSVG